MMNKRVAPGRAMSAALVFLATLGLVLPAAAADPATVDRLRMNQVQVIGTHNSYHVRDAATAKREVRDWNYSHPPLDVQLDRGVRSFELDLHYKNGAFEVFHVPIIDEGTTFRMLADGLARVRRWSEAHPRHVPISFLFEIKKEGPGLDQNIKEIDAAGFDRLDAVLREAFPRGRIITPDSVRGSAATLREAVTTAGWPTLDLARGKVLFILHDNGKKRELYTAGRPSLAGRVMFVRSDPTRDDAATLVMDNPRDPDIPRLVQQGYFVRTRADSGLRVDSPGQPARRDAALASGAHILSTDYPAGEAHGPTGYVVEFADSAAARVNPVNGPPALRAAGLRE
jgi:hypothetical protein